MRTQHLFLWISVLNSLVGEIALGKQKLYIGTFYGMNVSSQGWSSRSVMPAVQMALDHVNRDPVILPDFTLYEDWRDSKCDSGAAIRAMLDLMSSSPTKIMFTAPGCSPAAEPIAEAATFWGAVQVGFSNTSPLLSDDSRFPLFSRTSPSETLNNVAIVMTLLAMKWRRCAIIVQENNIFTKTKENLVYQLTEKGIKIEFVESFDDDPEYPVLNIKNKDVRIIIGLMYEDKFTKVACEAYKQRIYGRRYVWVLPGWYSEKWWENAGNKSCSKHQVKEAAGNYLATRPLRLGGSTSPTIAKKTATELSEELTEKSMRENYPINPFSSFAYDAIWSIALTLHQSSLILESRNKCLSNLTYGDSETAALFRDTLRNLNFLGMSGTVKFDKRGDRETTIEILQQQGNARVVVGFYNKSSNKIEESLLKWGGKPPTDSVIKEIEAYKASKEQTVVTMVLSLGGIMFSFVCLAVNIAYRKHRIIKMSSPHFNTITAIGCFFCYTHVLLETFNSSRIYVGECRSLCVIRAYLIIVGFTLAFGGMFAKTWRVYKIFTNRRLKREMGGLTTTKLMFRIFCILLLDVLVMVSWEIIDPLQSKATEISVKPSQGNDDIEIHTTVQQCVSRHYTSWVLGIMVFKGILLLFGVFLAWETRNVHYAELNDSKNIGVAVYNILLFSGLNITAEFVLSDLMAKRIFNNCLIYLCTTMVLGLVFLPKISRLTRKTQVRQPEGSQDQIQSHQSSLGNVNGQMSAGFVVSEIKQTSK